MESFTAFELFKYVVIFLIIPGILFLLGLKWSKDKDDPGIQKVGKTFMNLAKFMWFILIVVGAFKLIRYFLGM